MTTPITSRFLTKALSTLCCAGVLTACSAWATVVTWQLSPSGNTGITKDVSRSTYTITVRGSDNSTVTDASRQFLFKTAAESGSASETKTGLAGTMKEQQSSDTEIQQVPQPTLSRSIKQPDESLFAASNTPARPATELDEAMAKTFDEEFVSVPNVQFASMPVGSRDASGVSVAAVNNNPDPVPVPEMSALFPILGLIAAISCTQILRRRRAAQQSASRSIV